MPPAAGDAGRTTRRPADLGFPVLTTSRKRWDPVLARLPWTVEVFEIGDTD